MNEIDELAGILAERSTTFSKDRGADARELATAQRDRWAGVLTNLARHVSWPRCDIPAVRQALETLAKTVTSGSEFCDVTQDNSEYVVTSSLSILSPQKYKFITDFMLNNPLDTLGGIIAENGPAFVQMEISQKTNYDEIKILFEPIASFFATIHAVRMSQARERQMLQKTLSETLSRAELSQAAINAAIDDAANELLKAQELIKVSEKNIDEFIETSTQKVIAIKALAHESSSLESAANIWKSKVIKHYFVFILGIIALSVLSVGFAWAVLWNIDAIISHLPKKTDGDIPYGALAIMIIPLLACLWVLRIAGLWITNAQTLAEDSEQRRAMLDTYFALVADENAKMEQSDRILILNAIFRPLPGHQTEDVAPPSLLDLASDAMGGKRKT
ncbi:hypothetical protein GJ654_19140 [Rhodoblastus acidophilus]|uniref:DUF6161 domain-containing protein n=1 Tax=Rhodoblastus acidophilus TaxID=1074 RepID=A0A6N8DVC0_RHOAC|nr:DUF6161 domain-containing protein [Rhodoblastus acidophilus]MCW2274783.1 uncharacterized protein (DUF1778 family) [Rhodoblastus acidophilus]MTV33101.1 hypothetical protein [Rhodoblastus acidophilus]